MARAGLSTLLPALPPLFFYIDMGRYVMSFGGVLRDVRLLVFLAGGRSWGFGFLEVGGLIGDLD